MSLDEEEGEKVDEERCKEGEDKEDDEEDEDEDEDEEDEDEEASSPAKAHPGSEDGSWCSSKKPCKLHGRRKNYDPMDLAILGEEGKVKNCRVWTSSTGVIRSIMRIDSSTGRLLGVVNLCNGRRIETKLV